MNFWFQKNFFLGRRAAAANQKKTQTSHIGTPEPSVASAKECQAALCSVGAWGGRGVGVGVGVV